MWIMPWRDMPYYFLLSHQIGYNIQINEEKPDKSKNSSVIPNDDLPVWVYEEVSSLSFYKFTHECKHIIVDKPASLLRGISELFYCDICEPYITGDVKSPLLWIVALDARDYSFYSDKAFLAHAVHRSASNVK